MGEAAGPTFADSEGSSPATAVRQRHLRRPGRRARTIPTPRRASTAPTTTATAQRRPLRHEQGDGRVLAEVERLRRRRPPGDGVHAELQQQRGRLPGRPERAAAGRHLRRRHRRTGARATTCSSPARRPAQWHHYAFVLDSSAAGGDQQITPYVDGQPVPYTKLDSGTGAGNFANSTLYMMSRAGQSLFGAGDLDEVAIYNRALSASTVAEHYSSYGTNRRPVARFTSSPNPARQGQTGHLQRRRLQRPRRLDRQVRVGPRRQRQLRDRHRQQTRQCHARPTRPTATSTSACGSPTTGPAPTSSSQTVSVVANQPPTASFTASPDPGRRRPAVTFNASASTDPDGTIAKYEWDLDGNGTYETDTGTSPTASHTYRQPGPSTSACASPTTAA